MKQTRVQLQLSCVNPAPRLLFRTMFAAGAALAASAAFPCSGVGPPGQPVVFGNQTNIVIWDSAHRTEHFIRNANFRSGAPDFGFIAPTPGKPTLEQASNQAFYTLANLMPPPPTTLRAGGFGGAGFGWNRSNEVRVIQEADVAGYHATTLWSRSAKAVNDWMNTHGYVSTPEVEKWAERYTGRGWYLTAFKVIDREKLAASTGTIRMSFSTRKPYNPFYVPASNIQITRQGTLRVYFVSVGDYEAHIGNREIWQTPQWTAPIPETTAELLASQVALPAGAIPRGAQVETFVDPNFPRPAADDIYFKKVRKPRRQQPKPFVPPSSPNPPLGAMLPAVAGLGLVTAVLRRPQNPSSTGG